MANCPIGEWQIDDMGIEHAQYFQGYGTSFTRYDHSAYGIGDDAREALDDCLEQIAEMGFDTTQLERDIIAQYPHFLDGDKLASASVSALLESQRETDGEEGDDSADDCCELYYHVGIKWTDGRPALRLERLRALRVDVSLWEGSRPWTREREALADIKDVGYDQTRKAFPLPAPDKLRAFLADTSDEREELLASVRYTTGSDYCGSTLERSNYREFLEAFPVDYVKETSGGFSTYGIALDVRALLADETEMAESILETMEALEDYPVINEEGMSILEMELSEEGWKDWARDDFRRELEKLHNVDLDWSEEGSALVQVNTTEEQRELFDTGRAPALPALVASADGFATLFYRAAQRVNEDWRADGPDMYIDVSRVVSVVTREELAPFVETDYATEEN